MTPPVLLRWQLFACCLLSVALAMVACGRARPARDATPTPSPGLQSYRYDLTATATGVFGNVQGAANTSLEIKVAGEVAGPTQEHVTTRLTLGASSVQVERIRVGDRAWTRDAQQPWVEDRANTTGGSAGIGLDPGALTGPEANTRLRTALKDAPSSEEQLDGRTVLKYRVSPERLRAILGVAADSRQTSLGRIEGDSTLWVTKDEMLPVRLEADSTPTTGGTVHLDVRIRDQNAPGVVVTPPAG